MNEDNESLDYDPSHDPIYQDIIDFINKEGSASIALVQRHFHIDFNRAARLIEQLEKDMVIGHADEKELRSELNNQYIEKNNHKERKHDNKNYIYDLSISTLVFSISLYGLLPYINNKLWIILAVPIAILASAGIASFSFYLCLYFDTLLKKMIYAIVILSFTGASAYGLNNYTEKIQRIEQWEKQQDAQWEELKQKAAETEKKELEEKETKQFASSSQDIMTFDVAGNRSIFTSRAKRYIQQIAHDPSSVQDFTATTEAVRIRIKDIPQCRIAIGVRFRAKNAIGALVAQDLFVLFDKDENAFASIKKPLF